MSENAISADNQQATLIAISRESSETTRQTPSTRKEILAYLHGALHDASRNKRTRVRFVQKYPEWLLMLRDLLKRIEYRSWIYKEGKLRDLYTLETTCKELDFKFDPSCLTTDREKTFYIKGFFDAEGGIPRDGGRFYIQLVQKDYGKMFLIKQLLHDLGIESGIIHNPSKKVDPNYWRIFVKVKHHRMFAKRIGSFHPIKQEIFRVRMMI